MHWRWICLAGFAALAGALALRLAAAAEPPGPQFAGAAKCRGCHQGPEIGDQYGRWLGSAHAQAFTSLASDTSRRWAKERGIEDAQQSAACLRCHVSAFSEPAERLSSRYKPEEGVTCEACHGPGSVYRQPKLMLDRSAALANGLVLPSAAVCTRCHNPDSPGWDAKRYRLADGTTSGFDFAQAAARIAHPVPAGYDPARAGKAAE